MRHQIVGWFCVFGLMMGCGSSAEPLDGAVSADGGLEDAGDGAPANDGAVDGGARTDTGSDTGPGSDTGSIADAGSGGDAGVVVARDLCMGLTPDDRDSHTAGALERPAVGGSVADPAFGSMIHRVSDGAIPMYSTVSAWNADESRLLLYEPGGGHRLHDGRSYAFIGDVPIAPNDLEQVYWHTSDPDVFFFTEGQALRRHRLSSGTSETVHDFDFCSGEVGAGGDPFFTSFDSRFIGLKCGDTHFMYRIDTDEVLGMATSERTLAPQASPSGMLAFWQGDVIDTSLATTRSLSLDNPFEHASMGLTTGGGDMFISVIFDGSPIGSLVAFDMMTGAATTIIGESNGYPYPPGGTHVSGMAYLNPGWAWLSIVGSGSGLLNGELIVANYETGAVCRAGHHRSSGEEYFAEPHAAPSPSGTRAVFGSDWGGSRAGYVIELPSYVP